MKCPTCKKEFVASSNSQKFCGSKCRDKTYRSYRTDWQRNFRDRIAEEPDSNKIKCLICEKYYVQVGSHIVQVHKMTARKYRESFKLEVKRGILPEWFRKVKRDIAVENGTVDNVLESGKRFRFKKGQKGIGVYKRSQITINLIGKKR